MDGGLSGRQVKRIAVLLARHGHDPRPVFDAHGLPLASLDAPDSRVPYALVVAIGEHAAEITGAANVGLDLAMTAGEPAAMDVAGWMLMASADVRRALERAERYQKHWGDGDRLSLAPAPRGLTIRFRVPAGLEGRHHEECALAEVVLGLRAMTGVDADPRVVRFRHEAPDDLRQHRAIFRAPIEFGAERAELVLDDATLALPMKNAHAMYCAMFENEVERALAGLPGPRSVSREVKTIARAALLADDCTLRGVARRLGTSPRTLQRRLRAEETSFDAIVDAVRREMARTFRERGVPPKQIAPLLGYSEPSAFHRAAKRWKEA